MPTYEYECKSCSHNFEVFQSMSDPPLKDCPECGKEIRRLIFGGTGVIFKGSGFYVTDKGKSGKTDNKPCSDSGSSPQKTQSASCTGCPAADSSSKPASPASSGGGDMLKSSAEKAKPESKSA